MTQELPSTYSAATCEPRWRHLWEEKGAFRANPKSEKPSFCVMMPPPNVTGTLHMGHALDSTIQDILTRWKKMSGYETLWLPGTDHAGIATQTVVERHLLKKYGKHRCECTREEFLEHVWQWKESSQETIFSQIRAIGCACDWSRLRFSMDEQCSMAVRHMFKKLFDQGLIYRGNYLVNWDCVSGTALAEDEVEYEDRMGTLWTIRFPILGETDAVTIATTRPETMLGDTAVAVHPHDTRYQHLIGKTVLHPLTQRHIPIVADEFVDPSFGTGVVKITPAHDPNDYALAQRRGLPMINVITKDGRISEAGAPFAGKPIFQARNEIVAQMRALGFLVGEQPHSHRVGVSYRSKAIIEPLLSEQWFVKLTAFKDILREYVVTKKVRLVPETWEHTYFQWIDNLRDWCISRQLWWGHRVPIWYNKADPQTYLCYDGAGIPDEVSQHPDLWEQDPDVLDTWFSSALWPVSTLGWPENTPELRKFFPTSTLITGHDILFFWVARMIMMSHAATGQVPFRETFLHGLIYGKSYYTVDPKVGVVYAPPDERRLYDLGKAPPPSGMQIRWEKMSKSKGNVIDPMEIIQEYGADAMRLTLASVTTQASIIELDRRRFEEFQHFVNKVWNAARFVLSKISMPGHSLTPHALQSCTLTNLALEDRWILSRLASTVQALNEALSSYLFDKAVTIIYEFFWNEFCSTYIEISKKSLANAETRSTKQIISLCLLHNMLKLLHPFAPFITEELFDHLRSMIGTWDPAAASAPLIRQMGIDMQADLLCLTAYPSLSEWIDINAEDQFSLIQSAVAKIRAIRGEMKMAPTMANDLAIVGPSSSSTARILFANIDLLGALVPLNSSTNIPPDEGLVTSASPLNDCRLIIPVPEELRQREIVRLSKQIEKTTVSLQKSRAAYEKSCSSDRTPPDIIDNMKQSIAQQEAELHSFTAHLQRLSK